MKKLLIVLFAMAVSVPCFAAFEYKELHKDLKDLIKANFLEMKDGRLQKGSVKFTKETLKQLRKELKEKKDKVD